MTRFSSFFQALDLSFSGAKNKSWDIMSSGQESLYARRIMPTDCLCCIGYLHIKLSFWTVVTPFRHIPIVWWACMHYFLSWASMKIGGESVTETCARWVSSCTFLPHRELTNYPTDRITALRWTGMISLVYRICVISFWSNGLRGVYAFPPVFFWGRKEWQAPCELLCKIHNFSSPSW